MSSGETSISEACHNLCDCSAPAKRQVSEIS